MRHVRRQARKGRAQIRTTSKPCNSSDFGAVLASTPTEPNKPSKPMVCVPVHKRDREEKKAASPKTSSLVGYSENKRRRRDKPATRLVWYPHAEVGGRGQTRTPAGRQMQGRVSKNVQRPEITKGLGMVLTQQFDPPPSRQGAAHQCQGLRRLGIRTAMALENSAVD